MALKFRRHEEKPDAPGYLRRRMHAIGFFDALEGAPSVEKLNAIIEFILDHVEEPKDKTEARELLMDLSATEYTTALGEILAQPGQVSPESSGGSENG